MGAFKRTLVVWTLDHVAPFETFCGLDGAHFELHGNLANGL